MLCWAQTYSPYTPFLPVRDSVRKYGLFHNVHADDGQLYIVFMPVRDGTKLANSVLDVCIHDA